jgi:hypothetical protein
LISPDSFLLLYPLFLHHLQRFNTPLVFISECLRFELDLKQNLWVSTIDKKLSGAQIDVVPYPTKFPPPSTTQESSLIHH